MARRSNKFFFFTSALILFLLCMGSPWLFAAEESRYLTGRLLVASPKMPDPRFARTVIYMVKHDENGAMGFIVNRPIAKGLISDLLKGLGLESEGARGEIILYSGGPVEAGGGFIIHSDDVVLDTSTVVRDGIAFTSDVKFLREISLGKGPKRNLFVLGYAGWAPGQLEAEIKAEDWFSIAAEEELVFGAGAEKKWDRATDKRKIEL